MFPRKQSIIKLQWPLLLFMWLFLFLLKIRAGLLSQLGLTWKELSSSCCWILRWFVIEKAGHFRLHFSLLKFQTGILFFLFNFNEMRWLSSWRRETFKQFKTPLINTRIAAIIHHALTSLQRLGRLQSFALQQLQYDLMPPPPCEHYNCNNEEESCITNCTHENFDTLQTQI